MSPLTTSRNPSEPLRRRLLLFCKHPLARERFKTLLLRCGFEVVAVPELAVSGAAGTTRHVSLAIIDASESQATRALVHALHKERPQLPLLVLLPEIKDHSAFPLLRLGVKGVLPYDQLPELPKAAAEVAAGLYFAPRDLLSRFLASVLPELHNGEALDVQVAISPRERQVLDLVLQNLSNKEIASKLFVSERTVKFHVSNLLSKFQVQRRTDLIVLWMQHPGELPWRSRELGRAVSTRVN